jgi:hypothetical protein
MDLANNGFVDQQALLEGLNIPNADEIIERMAEDKLGQAMQILIGAGMPEEQAMMIMQVLQEAQGAPGNRPEAQQNFQARNVTGGVPKAYQGEMNANV